MLVRWGSLLILDLGLNVVDGVRTLHLQHNRLASEGLDEDLHATMEREDQMEIGLLLDVVIWESSTVFELLRLSSNQRKRPASSNHPT